MFVVFNLHLCDTKDLFVSRNSITEVGRFELLPNTLLPGGFGSTDWCIPGGVGGGGGGGGELQDGGEEESEG